MAIPHATSNSFSDARSPRASLCFAVLPCLLILGLAIDCPAADWSSAEQDLARKIVSIAGPGPVSLTFENHSSLGRRDSEAIQNGFRSLLEKRDARPAKPELNAAVKISLSENLTAYVWVAEISRTGQEPAITMTSIPRSAGAVGAQDAVPLSLQKILLWTQAEPMLDVAVLEENTVPVRIGVLSPENLSLYRLQSGKWQLEQALHIAHTSPWPRDMRGRLIMAKDHLLDVYLPGVVCRSAGTSPVTLACQDSNNPWPLGAHQQSPEAFFAASRNFFTGALAGSIGRFESVPKFYSSAWIARDNLTLWIFAGLDGQIHIVDGNSDQAFPLPWGSDLSSVKTPCGAGWQVLATNPGDGGSDSIRAYEFPDRSAVAVSAGLDFPGGISALWTEARGDTAVAITKDQMTGSYEAFRLAVACNQ